MTDEELLRAHEPILRFTHGELFLPADAERYIAECDLFMGRSSASRVSSRRSGRSRPSDWRRSSRIPVSGSRCASCSGR